MGATLSKGGQSAEITKSWLLTYIDSATKLAYSPSLESFTSNNVKYLALAYQASDQPYAGSSNQSIRFQLSKDGGDTWSPSRVVMWSIAPVWNPVLFYDTTNDRLFLFYSESRKSYSPGGDIKYVTSTDLGTTWSVPTTILTHESDGEVPKVTSNKPCIDASGRWYLGYHAEPAGSYRTFNDKTFSAQKEADAHPIPLVSAPPNAPPQSLVTNAGILISDDAGTTWKQGGTIEDARTWLIQPSVEIGSKQQLLAFFRTAAGKIYTSTSIDNGITWQKPWATALPCPNSKSATVTIDGQILMAYNPSITQRAPLALALSINDGRSWEPLVAIEEDTHGCYSCPTIAEWSDDTVKLVYNVWGVGLRMATVKLATVEG